MAIGTAGYTATLAVTALESHGLTSPQALVAPFILRGLSLLGIDP